MTKNQKMFANIYDLIKVSGLKDSQNDDWAILSRQFAKEAKNDLGRFMQNKNIELDNGNGTITIGKNFKLQLVKA